jgi:excisionase family DNA binding protein
MTTSVVPLASEQPTMQVDELPKVLGISRASVYEAVKNGDIPSIHIGRRIVIPTAAVRRMLQLDGGPHAA